MAPRPMFLALASHDHHVDESIVHPGVRVCVHAWGLDIPKGPRTQIIGL